MADEGVKMAHTDSRFILLDLSNIVSVIVSLINDQLEQQLFNHDNAFELCIWIVRYHIDIRCMWITNVIQQIDDVDREISLRTLCLPEEIIYYMVHHMRDIFANIDRIISQMLDGHVELITWNIWGVEVQYNNTICLTNQGDYRIEEWARIQESTNSKYTHMYTYGELRGM